MPYWFWFIPAGAIVLLALFVLYRHFFRKKGDCCGECRGRDCGRCRDNRGRCGKK